MAANFNQKLGTLLLCVTVLLLTHVPQTVSRKHRRHPPVQAFFQGHCWQKVCEQKCRDFDDVGFACWCYHGYQLNEDGFTCSKKSEEHKYKEESKQGYITEEGDLEGKVSVKVLVNETNSNTVVVGNSEVFQVVDGKDNAVKQTTIPSETNVKSDVSVATGNSDDSSTPSDSRTVGANDTAGRVILSSETKPLQTVQVETYDHSLEAPTLETDSLRHRGDVKNLVPYPLPSYTRADDIQLHKGDYLSQVLPLAEPCDEFSCENKGKCVDDGTHFRNKLHCDCPLGFIGEKCEKAVEVRYPRFYGNSYLALPVLKSAYKELDIVLEFKPSAQYGLLLFSAEFDDARTDFFSLALIDGFVEFRYDCGTGMGILRSSNPAVMGEWNTLKVLREDNMASLWLNSAGPVEGISKGAYSRLTLRLNLYVGGYDKMDIIEDKVGTVKGFVGCVEQILVNGYKYDMRKLDLVGDSQFGVNVGECSDGVCDNVVCENQGACVTKSADSHVCLCPLGTGGENCQHHTQVHIPEFSGHSYLQYGGLGRTALLFLEVEIILKPSKATGLILYNGYTLDRKGDFISLTLKEGHVEFRFDLGTGPAVIRSPKPISLNQWHWIKISRTGREGILVVDDEVVGVNQSPGAFTQLTLMQDLYIGGHRNYDETSQHANVTASFQGCIQKLLINSHPVQLVSEAIAGVNIEGCEHPCLGQPCLNGGECVPRRDVYSCYCPLGFTDNNCENELESDIDSPQFTGESFLMFAQKKISKRFGGNKLDLRFSIRPQSANGLLFWSGQDEMASTSDYIAIGFVEGALQFRYNLGSGEAVMSYNDSRLFDGSWHEIHAQRDKQDGYLMVDEREIVEGSSKGSYTMLNTNKVLYIGGLPDVPQNTLRRFSSGYVGCLRGLVLAEDYPLQLIEMAQGGRNVRSCS